MPMEGKMAFQAQARGLCRADEDVCAPKACIFKELSDRRPPDLPFVGVHARKKTVPVNPGVRFP